MERKILRQKGRNKAEKAEGEERERAGKKK